MSSSIFEQFSSQPLVVEKLKTALSDLCFTRYGCWTTLTLTHCNAACKLGSSDSGTPFSKAFVEVEINTKDATDELYGFGMIFKEYLFKLQSYLNDPTTEPSDKTEKLLFSKLFQYILEGQKIQTKLKESSWECDTAMILAEHVFTKLSVSPKYTIDMKYPYRKTCVCGCITDVSHHYGDTSIGDPSVWHGRLDLVLGSVPVIIQEDEPESPGGKSSVERKNERSLEDPSMENQIIPQTIVCSFLQKKNHPELSNFMIPGIGASRSKLIFYFYDSEKDILLRSRSFPFIDQNKKVSLITTLAAWFVVNYKFMCTGIDMKGHFKNIKKANFFEHAEKVLPVYQKELSFGGVESDSSIEKYEPFALSVKAVFNEPPAKKSKPPG